jgi:hypothetical protein
MGMEVAVAAVEVVVVEVVMVKVVVVKEGPRKCYG